MHVEPDSRTIEVRWCRHTVHTRARNTNPAANPLEHIKLKPASLISSHVSKSIRYAKGTMGKV
jgi:hypothetical protein